MKTKIIWIIAIIFLMSSILAPSIVQTLFFIGENNGIILSGMFKPSEILTFFGSTIGALATVFLGALALYQNKLFKKENDKSQEYLNNSVKELAQINERLLSLEEKNQKIQLLMTQQFIPLLELHSLELHSSTQSEAPEKSEYKITKDGEISDGVTFDGIKGLKKIKFIETLSERTTLAHYQTYKLHYILITSSEAKILSLQLVSLSFGTSPTLKDINIKNLVTMDTVPQYFYSCNMGEFDLSLILSDDYQNYFSNINSLNFEFLIVTTAGVALKETIGVNPNLFDSNKDAKYTINLL